MLSRARTITVLLTGIVSLPLGFRSAHADGDIQSQVSVYGSANAVGYLQPLANAFGAALNSSFGHSAYIPTRGFQMSIEAPVMGVFFEDADYTFAATSEAGFQPATTVRAPTVVGSGESVTIEGVGGATYSFPGGLDLNSFALVVPQLRVSSVAGTEAVLRWVAFNTGDSDIGDISLFGIGGRHSLSQYMGEQPLLDLAVGALWQQLGVGEGDLDGNFFISDALTVQLQASRRSRFGFLTFEPYATVAWEKLDATLTYVDLNNARAEVPMQSENHWRTTIGAGFNFVAGHLWADYSFAHTDNFSFGLALGNAGRAE